MSILITNHNIITKLSNIDYSFYHLNLLFNKSFLNKSFLNSYFLKIKERRKENESRNKSKYFRS